MTVAIGLVCEDGVIVASDSMASTSTGNAMPSQKVNAFENNPVIWTAAGSVYVKEEVAVEFATKLDAKPEDVFTGPQINLLRNKVKNVLQPTVHKCYKSALSTAPYAPGMTAGSMISAFLLLGYSNGTGWFLEMDHDGSLNWHHERGFYAIGSGGPFAQVCHALMKHYMVDDLSLEQGLRLAYRAIETTCSASSGHVGLPVQLAVVDEDGARILTPDEVSTVGTAVERWMELERDTLQMSPAAPGDKDVEELPSVEEA